jgi:hypothetical protein
MARPKRSSVILQKAEKRQAGLQSIAPALDLGNQLTLDTYSTLIENLRSQVAIYNRALSALDDQSRQLKETEQQLRSLSEQMLLGVAAKYGKDSREYGKAGGTPKSERRRPVRKNATQTATSTSSEPLQPAIAISTPEKSELVNGNGNGNGKVLLPNMS